MVQAIVCAMPQPFRQFYCLFVTRYNNYSPFGMHGCISMLVVSSDLSTVHSASSIGPHRFDGCSSALRHLLDDISRGNFGSGWIVAVSSPGNILPKIR